MYSLSSSTLFLAIDPLPISLTARAARRLMKTLAAHYAEAPKSKLSTAKEGGKLVAPLVEGHFFACPGRAYARRAVKE